MLLQGGVLFIVNTFKIQDITVLFDVKYLLLAPQIPVNHLLYSLSLNKSFIVKACSNGPVIKVLVASIFVLQNLDTERSEELLFLSKHFLSSTPSTVAVFVSYTDTHTTHKPKHISVRRTDIYKLKIFMNTPTLKMIITIDPHGRLAKIVVICNNNCKSPGVVLPFLAENICTLLESLATIHKRYFSLGHNQFIPFHVPWAPLSIDKESKLKSFNCVKAYRDRNYYILKRAQHCYGKQMIALHVSLLHNFTVRKSKNPKAEFNFGKAFLYFDAQPWIGEAGKDPYYQMYSDNTIWWEGAFLEYFSGYSFTYCAKTNVYNVDYQQFNYSVWIKPFSKKVWIACFVFWMLLGCVLALQAPESAGYFMNCINSMIEVIVAFLPVSSISGVSPRFRMMMVFVGIVICLQYSNGITSYLTVCDSFDKIKTVQEMFDKGFRIITREKYLTDDKKRQHYFLRWEWNIPDYQFIEKKLVWLQASTWKEWYRKKLAVLYTKFYGVHISCNLVKEEIDKMPWYFVIHTMNRYWMMKTMQRIYEGGLMPWWDTMAQYAEANMNRKTFISKHVSMTPNLIKASEIFCVLFLLLVLDAMAIAIFMLELYFCHGTQFRTLMGRGYSDKYVFNRIQATFNIPYPASLFWLIVSLVKFCWNMK